MEKFVVGDIVVARFPFSDLSDVKHRPALVLALAEFGDLILCQITSKPYSSRQAIALKTSDFAAGGLAITSYVRPDKLFTTDTDLVVKSVGTINQKVLDHILSQVQRLFSQRQ